MTFEHKEITEATIGAAFEVHNVLGYGFLEKVYQKAMQEELIRRGRSCTTEAKLKVKYKGVIVGEYFADLLVDDLVIVEIKVAKDYRTEHEAKLLNELKASEVKIGLLINFGKDKVEFKRMAM
jgi:GxxExxY protein